MDFWYDEDTDIVEHISLREDDRWPPKWTRLGFRWEQSYDDWLSLLKRLGYEIKIVEKPHIKTWNGQRSFAAEIAGRHDDGDPHWIKLEFGYSTETESSSTGTLMTMTVASYQLAF